VVRLALSPPYPRKDVLAWLAARAVPGVEELSGGVYRRTLRTGGGGAAIGVVELEPHDDHVRTSLPPAATNEAERRCRALLDLDADPRAVSAVLAPDPVLGALLTRHPGVRVPGAVDRFESAARTVLGQQVSLAAARTLAARIATTWGTPLHAPDGGLTHAFPTAAALAEADLAAVVMPAARRAALGELARRVAGGRLDLGPGCEPEEARRRLLEVPGIGPWTASYIALRALGDRDAFPAPDLGLRRAARRLGLPSVAAGLDAHARRWRPVRAYAAHLLWASGA
jgi:AraC family transcriptional regulator, regulatory protein of adaptative response / DNA-3-methyladenine glycosylase II